MCRHTVVRNYSSALISTVSRSSDQLVAPFRPVQILFKVKFICIKLVIDNVSILLLAHVLVTDGRFLSAGSDQLHQDLDGHGPNL